MTAPVAWRHVVLGVGFLALAAVRAAQSAPVWAVVFALAAATQGWLALRGPDGRQGPTAPAAPADPVDVECERARCHASHRRWQVLGAVGALVAAGLLLVEPPLAVLGGAAALLAVVRGHRERRRAASWHASAGRPAARVP